MNSLFKSTIFVLSLTLLLTACSKKPAPAPTPAPAATSASPASPTAPAPAPAANLYDGSWSGDSGENLPLSFSVEKNQVSSLSASYAGKQGTCSFNGSISSDGSSPVNGKTFTAHGKNEHSGVIEFTAQGTFNSPTETSGTVVWKGKSELCGDIDLQYKWAAKKSVAAPEED